MKCSFSLSDLDSFLVKFMLSYCPEKAENYEVLGFELETMRSYELKHIYKQLLIFVNLRHIHTKALYNVCMGTLNMEVQFNEELAKVTEPAEPGSYNGRFFQCDLIENGEDKQKLEFSLYKTIGYYGSHIAEMFGALALASDDELIRRAYLQKVEPEPKLFNDGNAGYAWKLDEEKAVFLYAEGNVCPEVWRKCLWRELMPCVLYKIVRQPNGKFYYATEKTLRVSSNKFITAKEAKAFEPMILQKYVNAKFWGMPIPATYKNDCWLMGEVLEACRNCYLILDLVSGEVETVEVFYFYQLGGLASPENKNFVW